MRAIFKLLYCSLRSEGKAHFLTLLSIVSNSAFIMFHCARIEAMLNSNGRMPFGLHSFGFGRGLGDNLNFGNNVFLQQAFSSVGLLVFSSLFIIFATRFLAMQNRAEMMQSMRKIGLSMCGLLCFIVMEVLCLGILGCFAGIMLGYLVFYSFYGNPAFLPLWSISFTGASIMATTLLANMPSVFLFARNFKTLPIGRMTVRNMLCQAATGMFLLCLMTLICFGPEYTRETRLKLFSTLGTVLFMAAIALFTQPSIFIAEKLFNPVVSRCLGINPMITRHSCIGNKWRAVACTLALSSGLSIYLAIHIWSSSMLNMFRIPDTIPNAIVRFHPSLAGDEAKITMQNCPYIFSEGLMDLCVAQPRLGYEQARKMQEANALGTSVIAIGVKANQAWGKDALLKMPFLQGCRHETELCFQRGERVCVIPDTLAHNAQLQLNQCLMLESPFEDEPLPYRVVGIVEFPWVWFSKCSGLRTEEARCAAVVFLPFQCVQYDFDALENEFFWFNASGTHEQIDTYAKDCAEILGFMFYDGKKAFSGGTRWDSGLNEYLVQTSTRESMNASLENRSNAVVKSMARIPFVALILASISIAGAISASIVSRKRELFIMRILGANQSMIARNFLTEAILLGTCACTLSTFTALAYAIMANKLVDYAPIFGIMSPPLSIPIAKLVAGYMCVLLISGIMGLLVFCLKPLKRQMQ